MQFSVGNYEELRAAIEELSARLSARNISDEKLFDSKLVAYELLANVLQHSVGGASLEVEVESASIRMTLRAETPFAPPAFAPCPSEHAERGRGLFLIDSVCVERARTPEGDIFVRIRL